MRQVSVVRQSVQTRTRTSLIASCKVGRHPGVFAGGGDMLGCRIEAYLTLCVLFRCGIRAFIALFGG